MSTSLQAAQRTLKRGSPLRLDQVTDLLNEGVDVNALETALAAEDLEGVSIIDERDFSRSYSEDLVF